MNQPVALSIAGSDNSAGAGIQADLKTFSALGVYGLTAVTCVVAEVPGKVSAVQPMDPSIVAEQVRLCLEAYPVTAVKTGMLFSSAIIDAVLPKLESAGCPLVIDPVMVATSGDPLIQQDAIDRYCARLFPRAALVTPNLDEVRTLLGYAIESEADMREAGHALAARHGCAWLIKGGHLRGESALDLLVLPGGETHEYRSPFVHGVSTHGTGCTTSAAIAAGLARGLALHEAVAQAKCYVHRAIESFLRWERAAGRTDALHHFVQR